MQDILVILVVLALLGVAWWVVGRSGSKSKRGGGSRGEPGRHDPH